jgi:uncharacterized protein (TIGR01244 family)
MKALPMLALLATVVVGAHAAPPPKEVLPPVANAVAPQPGIVSSGRIVSADIDGLRAAGIRHVIDLTPDAETPGFDEAAAVRDAGLAYSNLPLAGAADLTRDNVLAFDALMKQSARPVLVHCASGNRVGAMAALRAAWVDGLPADDAVAVGKAWGLASLEGAVRERLAAPE